MIDLQQVETELKCARKARMAAEAAGCELEELVREMQSHAWSRLAFIDETYDPHLVAQRKTH
jgi:hypothetical protein